MSCLCTSGEYSLSLDARNKDITDDSYACVLHWTRFSAVSGRADCTWSQKFTFPVLFSCLPLSVYDLSLLTSL